MRLSLTATLVILGALLTTPAMAWDANASAVALKKGASKNANFSKGVAVFTHPKGGLMFEAAVGGQKFSFTPK